MLLQYFCFLLAIISIKTANGIGCYVCSSINGSDPKCEDEFDAYPEYYHEPCSGAWRDRVGLFPARWCYKLTAVKDNYTVVVRNCALNSGGMTKDVEIGTLDHCGLASVIEYNSVKMKGCLMTCSNDGCNKALSSTTISYSVYMSTVITIALIIIDRI